jgi:hypothetical protein
VDDILSMVGAYFPAPAAVDTYCNKPNRLTAASSKTIPEELMIRYNSTGRVAGKAGDVKYVFVTKAGPGPIKQPVAECILDPATGEPVVDLGPKHKRMRIGDN